MKTDDKKSGRNGAGWREGDWVHGAAVGFTASAAIYGLALGMTPAAGIPFLLGAAAFGAVKAYEISQQGSESSGDIKRYGLSVVLGAAFVTAYAGILENLSYEARHRQDSHDSTSAETPTLRL